MKAAGVGDDPDPRDDLGDRAPEPSDSAASAMSARRLLAANRASVPESTAADLRGAFEFQRRPLLASLEAELSRIDDRMVWGVLGLSVPEPSEVPDEELLFDPRNGRALVQQQLALFEEAAGSIVETISERSSSVDWLGLSLSLTLPLSVRGRRLGDSLLQIPGGLTLPPIIAVLTQSYADATTGPDERLV